MCLRTDIKMDIGRPINKAIDYGQIEGAFIQGMGLFTMEELLWHRASGTLFTRGPGTYKIPGFRDMPRQFTVSTLRDREFKHLKTIHRSKGIGELSAFPGGLWYILPSAMPSNGSALRTGTMTARLQWQKLMKRVNLGSCPINRAYPRTGR